jgi:hypothetical protein
MDHTPDRERREADDGRYMFIHIMKTAGTTLVHQLQREFPPESIYPSRTLDRRFPTDKEPYMTIRFVRDLSPARRSTIRLYTGHFPYMVSGLLGDVSTFTLLRDPVTRTISLLKQFKRRDERFHDHSLEAIYDDQYVFKHFIHNHQTRVFALRPEDQPRAVLRDISIDDAAYATAARNLASLDVIGVTERYEDFLQALQDRFGWWRDGIPAVRRQNVSQESWNVSRSLQRRIADDNIYDMQFYEHACSLTADSS